MKLPEIDRKNLIVDEFTNVCLNNCQSEDRLKEIKILMSVKDISYLLVCDNAKVVGILYERAFHGLGFEELEDFKVKDVMVRKEVASC